jgi:hypothetical protein
MLEFQATAVKHLDAKAANSSYVIPASFCGSKLNYGGSAHKETGEVALNHFVNRQGQSLPNFKANVLKYRPMTTISNIHIQLETLTHADVGNL